MDGVELHAALDRRHRQDHPVHTMLGTRGIWHAAGSPFTRPRPPAGLNAAPLGIRSTSQTSASANDLAAGPDKLEEPSLRRCGLREAAKYNGLPLADLNLLETMTGRGLTWSANEPVITTIPTALTSASARP